MAHFITKDGLEELQQEYKELLEVKIPENLEALNAALQLGDLRENSERDSALDEQQRLQLRKQEIEEILNDYTFIETDSSSSLVPSKTIVIGSKVKVEYLDKEEIYEIKIMGSTEADVLSDIPKISNESPLARAIIGKKINDVVDFKVKQKIHTVKILEISHN